MNTSLEFLMPPSLWENILIAHSTQIRRQKKSKKNVNNAFLFPEWMYPVTSGGIPDHSIVASEVNHFCM